MAKEYQKTIIEIGIVRNHIRKVEDFNKDLLIKIGAGLESQIESVSKHSPPVKDAYMKCLMTLQTVFQETPENSVELIHAIGKVLAAIEQTLGTPENPMTKAMLDSALSSLITCAETGVCEPPEYEEAVTEPGGPGSENETEGAGEPESADESEDQPEVPVLSSLDDVASLLIQIEGTCEPELIAIGKFFKELNESCTDGDEKKLAAKAVRELKKFLTGKTSDFDKVSTKLSEVVDGINEIRAKDERTVPAAEPEKVESTEPQKSPSASTSVTKIEDVQASSDEKEDASTAPGPDEIPDDADSELLKEFLTESRELLEAGESALLDLEADPGNIEGVNTVFRAFHTIKGSAGFLNLERTMEFAHHAESLLSRMREKEISCVGGYADLALVSCDILGQMLDEVERGVSGDAPRLPAIYSPVLEVLMAPEDAGVNESTQFTPPATEDSPEEAKIDATGVATDKQNVSSKESTVRVRTDRLDSLIDIVGELVIAQSMIFQDDLVVLGQYPELTRKVSHAGKIVRELQHLSMAMRMIPLRGTFRKMARIIRDVSQKLGKEIELVTDGEETEIDRNMVDFVANPLVHMVRNAADHGIEMPDVREKNGKSARGTIEISAYHSGGEIVIELKDDGAGLDREKILAKAISNGIIDSDKGMTDSQVYQLIFAPGFSTAKEVTDVSGRGVGMDVVRKNIEIMRGRVEITSEKGAGTTFTIRLPLTLAITDGMLVSVGNENFIVPTINIQLSFRPKPEMLSSVTGKGELVSLRGELMPVFRLASLYDVEGAIEEPSDGLLIIIADGRRRCAILVDELLGQHHVVAKSLGNSIGKIKGVSGGAILGDGRVGLILDTSELVALARESTSPELRKHSEEIVAA